MTGHVYRLCDSPITSFGVICFRLARGELQYLQIQRRDSLSYVEFVRGKYTHNNRSYLLHLFRNMTEEERTRAATMSFDKLWKDLWQADNNHTYQREFVESKNKFDRLQAGYYLVSSGTEALQFVNINTLVESTECELPEPEWSWPKGKRAIGEQDFCCALREFREETGIPSRNISVIKSVKPFEEVFMGGNHVRYRHIYYLAFIGNNYNDSDDVGVNPLNIAQIREVRRVHWFNYEQAQANIRDKNVERKELFRRIHSIVQKIVYQQPTTLSPKRGPWGEALEHCHHPPRALGGVVPV